MSAGKRDVLVADALEFVREWTAMDGRGDPCLTIHGRDLEDFRDQLAQLLHDGAA